MKTRKAIAMFGWTALAAALCASTLVGCRERDADESPSSTPPVAQSAPAPEAFTPSRETPVEAARSIRRLAETTWDPTFVADYIDPSQKWSGSEGGAQTGGAPALVGPALIYFARLHELRSAAVERFGDEAGPAVDQAADFFQVDALANGIREMFAAAKLEQVNQRGPQAYVAALDETGEQIGYSIVLRENQGEWLWIMLDGNEPWDQRRMGYFSAFLLEPLQGSVEFAREFSAMAEQVRAGEIGSLSELTERLRALPAEIG